MRSLRSSSLALASLLGLVVALVACEGELGAYGRLAGPTKATPTPTATPTPSPTPAPSPTATPEDCRIDYMTLRPSDGLTLAKDEQGRISLTPYQTVRNPDGSIAQREVSEACNLPRVWAIEWHSSSSAVVVVGEDRGNGNYRAGSFEPLVKRVGVGAASLTATLEGKVSNPVTVR